MTVIVLLLLSKLSARPGSTCKSEIKDGTDTFGKTILLLLLTAVHKKNKLMRIKFISPRAENPQGRKTKKDGFYDKVKKQAAYRVWNK